MANYTSTSRYKISLSISSRDILHCLVTCSKHGTVAIAAHVIADKIGRRRNTVQRHLARLRTLGYIERLGVVDRLVVYRLTDLAFEADDEYLP